MTQHTSNVNNILGSFPSKITHNLNFKFMGFNFNLGDRVAKDTNTPEQSESYMPDSILPPLFNRKANSTHRLSRMDIQRASTAVKRFIEHRLEIDLGLLKHTSPLVFVSGTGVNDELDGSESKSPVSFVVPNKDIPRGLVANAVDSSLSKYQLNCEVVQSLAKWKRLMLEHLECNVGEGFYCESTSIRKGYKGDVTHSTVADQWDFEIRIHDSDRHVEKLKSFVRTLWKIITDAEDFIHALYPEILLEGHHTADERLPKEITFITSQDLHNMYPNMNVYERETAATRRFGGIFIIGMGWPMKDGTSPEEVRSPSYDDWNLNGDIMVKHPLTGYRHELSSMGIRVNKDSLLAQLKNRGMEHEVNFEFQKAVINEEVPFSYGGGLGISRTLMLLLRTGHIGEVHCGVWHDDHFRQTAAAGIDMIPDRFVPTYHRKFNENDIAKLTKKAQDRMAKKEKSERTLVSIEVRPAEAETDVFLLWDKITSDFDLPGIEWEATCHITELTFGVKELCMTLTIDNSISLDKIIEGIEKIQDVQSVEVSSMTSIPDILPTSIIQGVKNEAMLRHALQDKKKKIVVVVEVHPSKNLQPVDLARLRHKISKISYLGIHWRKASETYKSKDDHLFVEMNFELKVENPLNKFVTVESIVGEIQTVDEVEFVYVKAMSIAN